MKRVVCSHPISSGGSSSERNRISTARTHTAPAGRTQPAAKPQRPQDARVYSHGGPIGCRTRGYILTADQSHLLHLAAELLDDAVPVGGVEALAQRVEGESVHARVVWGQLAQLLARLRVPQPHLSASHAVTQSRSHAVRQSRRRHSRGSNLVYRTLYGARTVHMRRTCVCPDHPTAARQTTRRPAPQ
eukprot:1178941-Prorocentrum_minimum.AAC.1